MADYVRQDISDGVARVTLDRPELHNAFNEEVIEKLARTFAGLSADAAVRVLVLRSQGPSFCAGADIHWMKRMVDYAFEENVADAAAMARMLRSIRECAKPVIARVHGACIGGGVGLAAACDMVAAVESAVFCLSEVRLGIVPAVISPFVIEKIGAGAARRYGLTAERFGAAEARRIGLVSEVFESIEAMDAWIDATVDLIRRNGPEALAVCKRLLSAVGGVDWDRLQELTTRTIAQRRASDEGQEGLRAFLEKRRPSWEPRS